jgi:hypothetical protein
LRAESIIPHYLERSQSATRWAIVIFATRYWYWRWLVGIGRGDIAPHMWPSDSQPRAVTVSELLGELLNGGIIWLGIEQEHRPQWVLGETDRQHCPRCASANHDRIIAYRSSLSRAVQVCRWDYN